MNAAWSGGMAAECRAQGDLSQGIAHGASGRYMRGVSGFTPVELPWA